MTSNYTAEPLLNDTSEIRTPQLITKSQLRINMYYLAPEMRTFP